VARKRPIASDHQPDARNPLDRARLPSRVLTRAEARALSRSAPLTAADFKARRLLAEQRLEPLRVVLEADADAAPEVPPPA
jgi:hypothetical protein